MNINEDILCYYKCEETTSGTTNEITDHSFSGDFGGSSLQAIDLRDTSTAMFGSSLSGANGTARLSSFGRGDFSLSFWVKPTATDLNGAWHCLFEKTSDWYLEFYGNTTRWRNYGGSYYNVGTYVADTWTHIVITVGINGTRVYQDGVYLTGDASTSTVNNTNGINLFGWGGSTSSERFYGNLDEVVIYQVELDQQAVTDLYNNGTGVELSPVEIFTPIVYDNPTCYINGSKIYLYGGNPSGYIDFDNSCWDTAISAGLLVKHQNNNVYFSPDTVLYIGYDPDGSVTGGGEREVPTYLDTSSTNITFGMDCNLYTGHTFWKSGYLQNGEPLNKTVIRFDAGGDFWVSFKGSSESVYPTLEWYGMDIEDCRPASDGDLLLLQPFRCTEDSYCNVTVRTTMKAPNIQLNYAFQAGYQEWALYNTSLDIVSGIKFDKISMNGRTVDLPNEIYFYNNTAGDLFLDNFTAPEEATDFYLTNIYGGADDTNIKPLTFNNPSFDPDIVWSRGSNVEIRIDTDFKFISETPDIVVGVEADDLGLFFTDENDVARVEDIFFANITSSSDYATWHRLVNDPANGIVVDDNRACKMYVRKYGYANGDFNETITRFNGTYEKILYMKPDDSFELTQSEAEANIPTIKIIENIDYAENDKLWNYTLDCGGLNVHDVVDTLHAICCSKDAHFGRVGIQWWQMLQRDGESAKSVALNNGDGTYEGVRVINYGGNITTIQANDGSYFAPIQYANMVLTNLYSGTEVRVYEIVQDVDGEGNPLYDENGDPVIYYVELGGTESSGNEFTFSYNWSGDKDVLVRVYHMQYLPISFIQTLKKESSNIPISQTLDRNYFNLPAPILKTNTFEMYKDESITFTTAELVAGSTLDYEAYTGDTLTSLTVITPPSNGSFVDNGNGTYTYTPNAGYLGGDIIEYTPEYNTSYPGVITNGKIVFDVVVMQGYKYNNIIITGDSIMSRCFSSGYQADSFMTRHQEIFGSEITVHGEAISGYTTSNVRSQVEDTLLSKHASISDDALVWLSVATNDFYGVRSERIADPSYDYTSAVQTKVYNNLDAINTLWSNAGFKFAIGYQTFLKYDSGIDADIDNTIYNVANNVFPDSLVAGTKNELVAGSYLYNEHDTYGIVKAAQTFTPEFNTTDGKPMDSAYAISRLTRYQGFEDSVHPNYFGRFMMQQQILDTICLYNQYGLKPVSADMEKGFNSHWVVFDGGTAVSTDIFNRQANSITYDATTQVINMIDQDGVDNGYTLTLSSYGTGANVVNNQDPTWNYYTFNSWRGNVWRIDSLGQLNLEFGGLTAGKAYVVRLMCTYTGDDNTIADATATDTTFNRSIDRVTKEQAYSFIQFIILPQSSTNTVTLKPKFSDGVTYINSVEFYLLSDGIA